MFEICLHYFLVKFAFPWYNVVPLHYQVSDKRLTGQARRAQKKVRKDQIWGDPVSFLKSPSGANRD